MVDRILVVQTGFIGDIVLSSPVWANLKVLYPESEVWVLTTPLAKELVCYHPSVYKTLVFDKRESQRGWSGVRSMARELNELKFSKTFLLHKSLRTAATMFGARIPERLGFAEAPGRWLYTDMVSRKDQPHEVLRNLCILRHCGLEPEKAQQHLHVEVPEQFQEHVRSILFADIDTPVVGIAPGSVWETKRWTVDGFTTVARNLIAKGFRVALIGGASDAHAAVHINERLGGKAINLAGKTSLIESAAVIKQCSVLLTNDSAPMHIAAATGVPVVCIFCATIPEFGYGPWGVPFRVHEVSGLLCRPCGRHGKRYCPAGTHACQIEISTENVTRSVFDLVAKHETVIEVR